jgi:hypothetical protein
LPVPWATYPPEILRASAGTSGDGKVIWVMVDTGGAVFPSWQALHRYALGDQILDPNNRGLGGMALASAAVRTAPAIRAIDIPRLEELAVDRQFLLIGFAVSLASSIIFGLAPALQAWRHDLIAGLQRGDAPARRLTGRRFRDALVAAQLALVMVLLSGAGLMTNTLLRLLTVDLGFTRSNVFKVAPSYTPKTRDRAAGAQYLRELAQRIRLMPGVDFASVTNAAPLSLSYGGYVLDYVRDGVSYRVDALGRDVDPGCSTHTRACTWRRC